MRNQRRPNRKVSAREGEAAVEPHGLGSRRTGFLHQFRLGNRTTDGNNGWVRASPNSVMYGIIFKAALLALSVNVIACVVQARLSPNGIAKCSLIHALLFSSKGATSRPPQNALSHVHIGRTGASVPVWVGSPGLLRNPVLLVRVGGAGQKGFFALVWPSGKRGNKD